jgi:hypothetical protein
MKSVLRNLSNLPGWQTNRHIIVFESDDWGSIRTSSIEAVNRLITSGIDFVSLDAHRYSFNDTIETAEDLSALFDVLLSINDSNNKPAVFTAVSLVANPDFEKIRNNSYEQYYYEPFTITLSRSSECWHSFKLWKEGIKAGIFVPQFHGREHLNITAWMHALRNNHTETVKVFNEGMWGYVNKFYNRRRINYQEAFNIHEPGEVKLLEDILRDGLNLFEDLFGYRAKLFVAPNGPFPNSLEKSLAESGVLFITQSKIQNEPLGYGKNRRVFHYLGMRNKWGQIYLTRNCFFEPGSTEKTDWVDSCLHEIDIAFKWHKPAIICSHRVNYIGKLNIHNRQNGLKQLKELLTGIKNRWPDLEFMSSDQLGSLIISGKNK